MRRLFNSYWGYGIGCAIVWAILLAVTQSVSRHEVRHTILLIGAGWLIGWTSASIARLVYPPPKKTLKTRAAATPTA
jgi:hypothetical protein